MKKVIVIDNYDSFTYNLVHLIEEILGYDITIRRNDQTTLEEIDQFEYIILSPGPGIPEEAGMLKEIIRHFAPKKLILGVCLGHQAIGEVFGGTLLNLKDVYHGVQTKMFIQGKSKILTGLPNSFDAGRYHSWVIQKDTMPKDFIVTSTDDRGEIMSMEHDTLPLYGVQFHPESIMTPEGKVIIKNFLQL